MKCRGVAWFLFYVGTVLWGASCASLKTSYTARVAQQEQLMAGGNSDAVLSRLESSARSGSKDQVLHCLQTGYYHLFFHNYEKSREYFQMGEDLIEGYERRAVLSMSDGAALAQSLVSNDLELPYRGEGFEKIMLNSLLAMDYLFLNDLEGAAVEVRRADLRQKQAEEAHKKELAALENAKKSQGVSADPTQTLMSQFGVLDSHASKVVSSFQNGYTFFLSGLVHEASGNFNDAYIDYKKCFSLQKNRYALEGLMDLAARLRFSDDLEGWRKLAGRTEGSPADPRPGPAEKGSLTVIYFCDRIPQKSELKIGLPIGGQIVSAAFPFYSSAALAPGHGNVDILVDGLAVGTSEAVLDFIPIVAKSLKEDIPGMAARWALRALVKYDINRRAEKEFGDLGKLAANIFNIATERADLRGWYELPACIHVFRGRVEPGAGRRVSFRRQGQTILLDHDESPSEVSCDIGPGKNTVIFVHSLANRTTFHMTVI